MPTSTSPASQTAIWTFPPTERQSRSRSPPAALPEPNLDQDRTYLFSQSRGVVDRIGDAISTDDQQELYQGAEEKLAAAAAESALLEQAAHNTRAMLSGMLGSLGLEVVFTSAEG